MKKLLSTLILILPIFVYAQWVSTNINAFINAVSFLNQDTFLINANNNLLKTENGGQTFAPISNYPPQSCYNLFYKSIDTIFVDRNGTKGLLMSSDAGNSWSTQILLMPNGDTAFKSKTIFFFSFFDKKHGIIIGDTLNGLRQVFLSDDGGVTWNFYQHTSIDAIQFKMSNQVRKTPYIDEAGNLRLVINAKILFITDYGHHWSMDTTSTNQFLSDFAFKDKDTGFAFMDENAKTNFFKTMDGGISWSVAPRDTSYKLDSGKLIYAKRAGTQNPFILSPTSNIEGLTNISYDEGYSWHVFDTLNHQGIYFYNAVCGVSDFFAIGMAPEILLYNNIYAGLNYLEKLPNKNLKMFPNPANSEINFTQSFSTIQIWDIQGKLIESFTETKTIDVSAIPNGLYWVKAIDNQNNLSTQKLLIQH